MGVLTGDPSGAPLAGVGILDLTQLWPGPYATLILARLGATIWKIEPPTGDPMREMSPAAFESVNQGKHSVVLDLKQPEQRDILHRAVRALDVVVESFRPGVAERLGIDHATLSRLNPRIVSCSVAGFPEGSPEEQWAGHDINYVAHAGAVWYAGDPAGPPDWPVGLPVADPLGSMVAVTAVLAALRGVDRTGVGSHVRLAMSDVMTSALAVRLSDHVGAGDTGQEPSRASHLGRGSYAVFPCADGRRLAVGILEERFWIRFCDAVGMGPWAYEPDVRSLAGRRAAWAEVRARVADVLATRTSDEWLDLLDASQVPVTLVRTPREVLDDEGYAERGVFRTDATRGCLELGLPWRSANDQPWSRVATVAADPLGAANEQFAVLATGSPRT